MDITLLHNTLWDVGPQKSDYNINTKSVVTMEWEECAVCGAAIQITLTGQAGVNVKGNDGITIIFEESNKVLVFIHVQQYKTGLYRDATGRYVAAL